MSASRIKLGAILVGWVISLFTLLIVTAGAIIAALMLEVDVTSSLTKSGQSSNLYLDLIIIASILISFLVGGYVTGRMSALAGGINGAMVVVTSLLALFFIGTFAVIVGDSLDIDVMGPFLDSTESLTITLFIIIVISIAGGVFGGRFGEGYVKRLDRAIAKKQQRAMERQNAKLQESGAIQLEENSELEKAS